MRTSRSRWVWHAAVVAVIAFVLLYPVQGVIWDGGFPSAEFRLRFVDEHGQPVPGVRLEVFTQAGGPSPHYPVNEFRPGHVVESDADGRMAFHHVSRSLEFGGRERRNLLGMEFGESSGPRYACAFFHEAREVYRIPYNKLSPHSYDLPTVEREWTFDAWSAEQWEAYDFDLNHDGTLDREERVARQYVWRKFEWTESTRERFDIVEKTIVIGRPR